jgi:hypothetical protein
MNNHIRAGRLEMHELLSSINGRLIHQYAYNIQPILVETGSKEVVRASSIVADNTCSPTLPTRSNYSIPF